MRVLQVWLLRHLQVFFASLGQLWRTPLATLLTALVIAIALALPGGLHLLLKNVTQLGGGPDEARLSLYLQHGSDDETALQLAAQLRARPAVADVDYIDPASALQEFRRHSGLAGALDLLDENPLPPTLVVHLSQPDPTTAERLRDEFQGHAAVELAQLDLVWLQRLQALNEIAERAVALLAAVLALGVVLIVGNTLRLALFNRRREIEVMKLVGATDAFIRRPFLYTGLLYGVLGGLLAGGLITAALWLLDGPVGQLASLYQSSFRLLIFDPPTLLALPLTGGLLGLLAAWLTVSRHLRAIRPGE